MLQTKYTEYREWRDICLAMTKYWGSAVARLKDATQIVFGSLKRQSRITVHSTLARSVCTSMNHCSWIWGIRLNQVPRASHSLSGQIMCWHDMWRMALLENCWTSGLQEWTLPVPSLSQYVPMTHGTGRTGGAVHLWWQSCNKSWCLQQLQPGAESSLGRILCSWICKRKQVFNRHVFKNSLRMLM